MAVSPSDPTTAIVDSARLSIRSWVLGAPTFTVTILTLVPLLFFGGAGLLSLLMSGDINDIERDASVMIPSLAGGIALAVIIAIVLGVVAIAATYAGADDALHGRPLDLSAVLRRGTGSFGTVFAYFALVIAVGLCVEAVVVALTALTAGLLGFILIPLLICAGILAAYFLMYAMPAMVIGGRGALAAIRESYEIARANVPASVSVILGLIAGGICTWVAGVVLHFVPVLGALAGLALSALFNVFQAIVLTRFYLALRT